MFWNSFDNKWHDYKDNNKMFKRHYISTSLYSRKNIYI